jgi:sensor domain CHASE-containing protein
MVVAVALVISAVTNFFVIHVTVFPEFVQLEREAARKDAQRAVEALTSEIENIQFTLWDYSNWDETYAFVEGANSNYAYVNLRPESLKNIRMDIVEIYGSDRQTLYAGGYDKHTESIEYKTYGWHFKDFVNTDSVNSMDEDHSLASGLVTTPGGMVMYAARPILKSDGSGPSIGVFFFGRLLDDELIDAIRRKTKVDVELVDLNSVRNSLDPEAFRRMIDAELPEVSEDHGNNRLVTFWPLRDDRNVPISALRVQTRRDISESGERVLLASLAGVALSGFVVTVIIGLLLQWLLVGPLIKLTRSIVAIGGSGDISRRISLGRGDEIGILSREFDKMLGSLAEVRNRLLEHSYRSGVAEMASGVLHNLRNQLTPVNMHVERVRELIAGVPQNKIGVALDELTGKAPPPERVEKLAAYVKLSVQEMVRRQEGLGEQLAGVSQDLLRIEEILNELDRFSRAGAQLEAVSLGQVVEETIGLLPEFPDLRVRMKVDAGLRNQPPVLSMSFILKHVLHNLFVNAFEAIIATGRRNGIIEVSAARETIDERPMAHLQVRDDGIGIAPEHMREIFVRGFTTKKGGRRGTGLHWCANRIAAMGGKLFAESPGRDGGATLHVLLPIAAAAPKAVAR